MQFFYDHAGHLIGEYDSTANTSQETVWLGDLPVASVRAGVVYLIHADHLGTPRSITRASDNAEVWRWDSDPFGTTLPRNPNGAFTFNLRFPGQYFDAETNWHYNGMRDYDPRVGRYLQADPIGLAGGKNRYGYVGGNPLINSDPKGLVRWRGEMYAVTAISGVGGGQFWFDLQSECVGGKYAYIRLYASVLGAGLGIKYTGTASSISFDDHLSQINPDGFTGLFRMASAGIGAGLVGGYCAVRLGNNTADFSAEPSPGVGVDESISGLIGAAMLFSAEVKDCRGH